LNLKAKEQRQKRVAAHKIQGERIKYLDDEKRIKAVTVLEIQNPTRRSPAHDRRPNDQMKIFVKSWTT